MLWVMGFWIVGVIVSFINGNRALPVIILLLGIGVVAATFNGMLGYYGIAALAVLAVIMWIANKADMT
jgi:hypothetical protein